MFVDVRQRGRFAGFALYVSNKNVTSPTDIKGSTLCFKDGSQIPPLNFSTTCFEFGRYVIFYNERLVKDINITGYENNNVVTELCEVNIQGNN